MRTSLFDYDLPKELIPDRPARGQSRLLHLPPVTDPSSGATSELAHHRFLDLPSVLREGDLLVFNDTEVLRARLRGHRQVADAAGTSSKQSTNSTAVQGGGAVEALLVEPLPNKPATDNAAESRWLAMLRPGKRQRPGQSLVLGDLQATVVGRHDDFFEVLFHASQDDVYKAMQASGELPLPPYLGRTADKQDDIDYQTHFAKEPGAVAAPTAGLHFDDELLQALKVAGVAQAQITLHVGPGTFRPVTADDASEHQMDSERYEIPAATIAAIHATKNAGGRVIAVGTTVTRTLEGALGPAMGQGSKDSLTGRTDLFIVPGYEFHVIDGLITNFHLPRSTLLMLVSALAGRDRVLAAYHSAVANEYRFYSYGDAMLVWKETG